MATKIKKGSRVSVYGQLGTTGLPERNFDYYSIYGMRGTVTDDNGTELFVDLDDGYSDACGFEVLVHPKQCRRLFTRKK